MSEQAAVPVVKEEVKVTPTGNPSTEKQAPSQSEPATEKTATSAENPDKKEIKEEDVKAKRFAELSKKEQRILRRKTEVERELKEKEAALVAKEQEIERRAIQRLRELALTNPDKALEELGTDYNKVTDYKLNAGRVTPETVEKKVLSEVDLLRQQLEEMKNKAELEKKEIAEKKNQEILKKFSANIVNTVKNNADKYPSVNTFDGAPVIYEMIQQRFQETNGKHLMTIDEAAGVLEKDLSGLIEKVLQTPTWAKRFTPQAAKEEKKSQGLNKATTITNEMTPTGPSLLPAKTENDRIRRAMAKLAGEQMS